MLSQRRLDESLGFWGSEFGGLGLRGLGTRALGFRVEC